MKQFILFLSVFILFSCSKEKEITEEPLICGIPPARFILSVPKSHPHSQDFLDEKGEKSISVYFYKFRKDSNIKKHFNAKFHLEKENSSDVFFIELDVDNSEVFVTGDLETIYLNNKKGTDVIQIKAEYLYSKCGRSINVKELIVNGKKQEKLPNLHWNPLIHLTEEK